MGLYAVTGGEQYYVKADSREEAEAKYYVSLGYASPEDYPQFDLSHLNEDIEYGETETVIEPILDLS
jgi:uncharacterized membrane protein